MSMEELIIKKYQLEFHTVYLTRIKNYTLAKKVPKQILLNIGLIRFKKFRFKPLVP